MDGVGGVGLGDLLRWSCDLSRGGLVAGVFGLKRACGRIEVLKKRELCAVDVFGSVPCSSDACRRHAGKRRSCCSDICAGLLDGNGAQRYAYILHIFWRIRKGNSEKTVATRKYVQVVSNSRQARIKKRRKRNSANTLGGFADLRL